MIDRSGDHDKGEVIRFVAQRFCKLSGKQFRKGDSVDVTLHTDWNHDPDMGDGGPWGCGGFTADCLLRIASRIEETGRGSLIYRKP